MRNQVREQITIAAPDGSEYFEEALAVPASLPTPTYEYSQHRRDVRAVPRVAPSVIPIPIPPPILTGARVLIWKQDPTLQEIGIRKAYLPGHVFSGPRDARIVTQGVPAVNPNTFGDLIETPGTDDFDTVHTFAVVRQTLTMYQRARAVGNQPAQIPWAFNLVGPPPVPNTNPIEVFPKAGDTMNAFYSRQQKALKFFFFTKPGDPPNAPKIFTCRSLDIVAHETGHAVLDGLKPHWLDQAGPPQTGALHESFGDLTAIFVALSQLDQVEAVIAQNKANLHDKTFLSDLAEQFGLALGRPNGLRNADNDLTLSQVTNEVHDLSQVFTGAVYDIMADVFNFEKRTAIKDDAATLYDVGKYVCSLVIRSLIAAPAAAATFADVANQMLNIANSDGRPIEYRNFIRNRFTIRGVVVQLAPLNFAEDHVEGEPLVAAEHISADSEVASNLRGTCGTMRLPEFTGGEEIIQAELNELMEYLQTAETGDGRKNGSKKAQVRTAGKR
jgi:hypothetical protein